MCLPSKKYKKNLDQKFVQIPYNQIMHLTTQIKNNCMFSPRLQKMAAVKGVSIKLF